MRLSFAEAVQRAGGGAPPVQLATYRGDEARARLRQAKSGFLPSVSASGLLLNRDFNPQALGLKSFPLPPLIGPFNNWDARVTAQWSLLDFATFKRVDAAQAQVTSVDADRTVATEGAAQAAALAYLQAARTRAVVDARRADSSLAAELLRLAQAQKAAGVSAAIDVTRAQAQLVTDEASLLVALNQQDRARIALARALGLDPATPIDLSDTLAAALPVVDLPANRDSAVALALAGRPDLESEVARGDAARATGSAISAERLPQVGLEADAGGNGLTPSTLVATNQIALQVSVPLFDGFRREGRIAEQNAVAEEAAVRERDLRQQVEADVDGALLDLRTAAAQLAIAAERLRLADDELAQSRQRFSAGVAGNIEVIDAQVALVRARDGDIDARYGAAAARVALARAVGVARTLH